MESKLNLNWDIVANARNVSKKIADDTQLFIDDHTTVAVERTVCRLLGIDGVDEFGVPLPNLVVDNVVKGNGLGSGVAKFIGNAMVNYNITPQEVAERVSKGEMDLTKIALADEMDIKLEISKVAKETVKTIKANREKRENYLNEKEETENGDEKLVESAGRRGRKRGGGGGGTRGRRTGGERKICHSCVIKYSL